ncbi:MAG: pre-peptidase C-terminal domain-containing protein, partial [Armatimonadota bacterium]
WVFSAQNATNLRFVGEAAAHENGHGFNLNHQSDYSGNSLINEYSSGDSSRAPIMGNSYSTQRGLWKLGTADAGGSGPTMQNDVRTMLTSGTNPGFAIASDGIGHSLASATPLPLNGTSINYTSAVGVITPSTSAVTPSGLSNYSTDYWSFTTTTGTVVATVTPGRESISPGSADPGAMLDASLEILDSKGTVVASSITSSLSESITTNLQAGTYYLQVLSAADPNNTGFYDLGSYFLSGTIVPLLAGDFNHDGHLTAADIPLMESALATGSSDLQSIGDVNHDGKMSNADLQYLATLLKNGGGSTEPVPEPCSLALLGMGAFALLVSKGKSRRNKNLSVLPIANSKLRAQT